MAKDAATRLVQDELAQCIISGDEIALIPQGVARRWGYAADDDIADFAFCVAANYGDGFGASHDLTLNVPLANWEDRLAIVMVEA